MTEVNLNLNDIPDNVPPGWYPVRVESGEVKKTQDGDGEYIQWGLSIQDPDSEFHGWPLILRTPIALAPGKSKRALRMVKDFLVACGYTGDEKKFNITEVVGSELEVQVAHRNWQGRIQEDVNAYRPL